MKTVSKETFERLLKNEAHKSLCIIDVGSERNPDYIIAGIEHLVKDISNMLYNPILTVPRAEENIEKMFYDFIDSDPTPIEELRETDIIAIPIAFAKHYASIRVAQEKAELIEKLEEEIDMWRINNEDDISRNPVTLIEELKRNLVKVG